jgi:branched-chain amino acid transport system ATP-binding protein
MLECRGLSVSYGRHRALDDVAIRTATGEIVVILGANGAGKSTLLQAIAGLVPSSDGGQILLDGKSIRQLAPHLIVEAGLALVPEGRRIFGDLTVLENLVLGAYADRARSSENDNLERVFALFPRLAERRRQVARTMSGGEQQMVAIGRAMMSAPSILMLDEPSLGLSPILCSELFKALAEVRKTGAGILLVEQNARQGLAIADRGYLLENGRIVGEGPATTLARDPAVQKAYLGGMAGDVGARPATGQAPVPADAVSRASVPVPARSGALPARAIGQLIPGSINELVQRATAIQSEHVRAIRAERSSIRPVAAVAGARGDSLQEAIARIEAAAAGARKPRPSQQSGESGESKHVKGD